MELPIYLDHAATTPVAPEALEAMLPYFSVSYGNPATLYSIGLAAREAVETAREIVAETINARPEEIVFTSGGTEGDNAALRGIAAANPMKGRHILTTPIEHHAVLEPLETLARHGYDVEFLPVDGEGNVDPADAARLLRPDTLLVSVMHANNEIGTIQPIAQIGEICRERGVLFHTDAVQTFGTLPIDVRAMKVDLLSLSAHKLYGPKGVGALYIRRGVPIAPFHEGGEQEKGRRGGTLNVPGIVGLGRATERARGSQQEEAHRLIALRDAFIAQIESSLPGATLTGNRTERLPNSVHLCVEGVEGEPMLLALDAAGICASAGSACTTGSTAPSHVLLALGMSAEKARGGLRLTLGRATTAEALDYTLQTLIRVVADLRGLAQGNDLRREVANAAMR